MIGIHVQTVDLYLRRAKDCRGFAREARSTKIKAEFRAVAKAWKSLADQRYELLQLQEKVRAQSEQIGTRKAPDRRS